MSTRTKTMWFPAVILLNEITSTWYRLNSFWEDEIFYEYKVIQIAKFVLDKMENSIFFFSPSVFRRFPSQGF